MCVKRVRVSRQIEKSPGVAQFQVSILLELDFK